MLIKHLKETGVLKDGGRVLGSSDGCAKQHKYRSALRFMSHLSFKHSHLWLENVKWMQSMQWTRTPSSESQWRLCKIQRRQPRWGPSWCKLSLSTMSGEEKSAVEPWTANMFWKARELKESSEWARMQRERKEEALKEGTGMWEAWWSSWVMSDARLLQEINILKAALFQLASLPCLSWAGSLLRSPEESSLQLHVLWWMIARS